MGELSNTTINGVSYDFKDAGAARQSHSHTKSQITDFPTSMPASDVPAWAKASSKPSYTQDEVGDGTTYKRVSSTEKTTWNNKGTYSKPSGGIPKTDLASAVQTSLGKADSALQSETDPTVPSWAKASSKPSYTASEVGAVPNTSAGVSAAINLLSTGDSAPTDNDYYVSQYAGGGTSTTTYHRRPVSKLWEYIKSKLASKGSATQPVYFSNGVPVATTYTLGKSVPSDAKFTDTVYTHPTSAGNKHIPSGGSSGKILVYGGSSGTAEWGGIPAQIIEATDFITISSSFNLISANMFIQDNHIFGDLLLRATGAQAFVAGTIKTSYKPYSKLNSVIGMAGIETYNSWNAGFYSIDNSNGNINFQSPVGQQCRAIIHIDYLRG